MKHFLFALLLCLFALPLRANEGEKYLWGNTLLFHSACADDETGEVGHCYVSFNAQNETYLAFHQRGVLMFVRRITPTGYETVWKSHLYMGV